MPSRTDESSPVATYTDQKTTVNSTCSASGETSSHTFFGYLKAEIKERSWAHTPGYTAKVNSHQALPDNQFDFRLREMDVNARLICKDDTYFTGEDNGHPCYTQTTLERNRPLAQPAEDGGVISSQSGLFFKAIAKAKSNQFNLPIFLAEGGKTVDMVVGTANRLVRCLRQLRRGSLPGFVDLLHSTARKAPSPREVDAFNRDFDRNAMKAAGSMWLEHTYG
jgi:hypothetical protein